MEDTQTLLLDDHFFQQVLGGYVTATIRIGKRSIDLGRLRFVATHGNYLPVTVFVDSLNETTFAGLNDADAMAAGYRNAEDARRLLEDYYPSFKPTTPVTVIRFERV